MTKTTLKRSYLVTIIAVTLIAVTALTASSTVFAQAPPTPTGATQLHIAGAGIGTVTCANGNVFNNVITTISFNVPGEAPQVFLRNEDNTRQQHRSILFAAELTQNAYNLNGFFTFRGGDFICEETPVLVTVSGDCGIGVAITVVAPGSMTGAFVGNVVCV